MPSVKENPVQVEAPIPQPGDTRKPLQERIREAETQVRRSTRQGRVPLCPGNVYGEDRTPISLEQENTRAIRRDERSCHSSRDRTIRDAATWLPESGPSQAPSSSLDDPRHEIRQPGSAPDNADQEPELDSTSDDIYAKDSTLIGIDEIANALIENNRDLDLLCYLMSKVLDATDDSLPVTYCDILKLPDYQKIE